MELIIHNNHDFFLGHLLVVGTNIKTHSYRKNGISKVTYLYRLKPTVSQNRKCVFVVSPHLVLGDRYSVQNLQ